MDDLRALVGDLRESLWSTVFGRWLKDKQSSSDKPKPEEPEKQAWKHGGSEPPKQQAPRDETPKPGQSKQPEKWTSAGCVILPSLHPDDLNYVYVIKPSNNYGPWCFSEDTEILTRRGWLLGLDLTLEDEVATLVSGELVYERPSAFNIHDYKGEMVHFSSRDLDQLVTPNHRMWVCKEIRRGEERYSDDRFEFVEAQDVPMSASFRRHAAWVGQEQETYVIPSYDYSRRLRGGKEIIKSSSAQRVPMDAWLAFMGWFLSEGFASQASGSPYVAIVQNEGETADQIRSVLGRLPWEVYEHSCGDRKINFEIRDRQLWAHLSDGKRASQKRVPSYVGELSSRQIQIFLEAYWGGDGGAIGGHATRWQGPPSAKGRPRVLAEGEVCDTTPIFYTASPGMADDLSVLILKTGRAPKIRLAKHQEGDGHFGGQIYLITANKPHPKLCASKITRLAYEGKIWCPTTTSGVVYVRREGKATWSGNSFPKGRVDPGENFREAARREVGEETGLAVSLLPGGYLGKGVGRFSTTHYFMAVQVGGSPGQHDQEVEKVKLVAFEDAFKLFAKDGNKRDIEILKKAWKFTEKFRQRAGGRSMGSMEPVSKSKAAKKGYGTGYPKKPWT